MVIKMQPVFQIIFGSSAALVLIWLVQDTIRRARQRGELRREAYLEELEKMAAAGDREGESDQEESEDMTAERKEKEDD